MKEVVILSGKGGTGKTTLVGSLAVLAENKVLVDCDVDAADLHLLLHPLQKQQNEFWSGQVACIDANQCTQCGLCQDLCRFHAIHDFKVDPVSCEGCGFCSRICPEKAIAMKDNMSGYWFVSDTRFGPMVHARLGVAQENSGKLVATVRQQARKIAESEKRDLIISDGPPGIGCPVISSLSGASLALLVTEPTLSGMHDLDRVLEVCRHFDIRAMVCINKYDLNETNTAQIESRCSSHGIEIAGKIPFDNIVTESIVLGVPVVEHSDGKVAQAIIGVWNALSNALNDSIH
ncbi:MAG: ATP-binding protein [Acidobacteria bacterium]|nr:ATP-binding protein [Acidobacteriota bacterium]